MKRACALVAAYNERDVIAESVGKLIAQGLDVYLIDNGSTDGTADQVAHLVGQGLVDIETATFTEGGREVYDWTALLQRKEALSRTLGYDWYIHADADEIRCAPWPGLSLREGLDRVDAAGYQLVNFKLFNFRLSQDIASSGDMERDMPFYSGGEWFNQRQVKAWRAHEQINLAVLGGHHAVVPGARVYPTRFILKHYPVRSLAHGQRKILNERRARFSQAERQRGWHRQYDDLTTVDAAEVFWAPERLQHYDHAAECQTLLEEASTVLGEALIAVEAQGDPADERSLLERWGQRLTAQGQGADKALQLLNVAQNLARGLARVDLPPIRASAADADWLHRIVASMARAKFLAGDPLLLGRLPKLAFVTA